MQYVTQTLMSLESEERFQAMVSNLSLLRSSIFESMVFAIDHSEYSNRVLSIIIEGQSDPLARLNLISDILYNCNKVDIQYSWSYLPLIESKIPNFLMKNLKNSKKALHLIEIWEKWGVFEKNYLIGLKSIIENYPISQNRILEVYKNVLSNCDDYFLKKKCKEMGQFVEGTKNELVDRVAGVINYILTKYNTKEDWVYVEINSQGSTPIQVIEAFDNKMKLFTSPGLNGNDLEENDIQIISKMLKLYPNTYIVNHKPLIQKTSL